MQNSKVNIEIILSNTLIGIRDPEANVYIIASTHGEVLFGTFMGREMISVPIEYRVVHMQELLEWPTPCLHIPFGLMYNTDKEVLISPN